ncbi:unnamed protein product [Amoebophrya sp. A120]|nr:unnamed protein product [Amoebophrya sp. A120]|eukprot:GSA120T00016039001.1
MNNGKIEIYQSIGPHTKERPLKMKMTLRKVPRVIGRPCAPRGFCFFAHPAIFIYFAASLSSTGNNCVVEALEAAQLHKDDPVKNPDLYAGAGLLQEHAVLKMQQPEQDQVKMRRRPHRHMIEKQKHQNYPRLQINPDEHDRDSLLGTGGGAGKTIPSRTINTESIFQNKKQARASSSSPLSTSSVVVAGDAATTGEHQQLQEQREEFFSQKSKRTSSGPSSIPFSSSTSSSSRKNSKDENEKDRTHIKFSTAKAVAEKQQEILVDFEDGTTSTATTAGEIETKRGRSLTSSLVRREEQEQVEEGGKNDQRQILLEEKRSGLHFSRLDIAKNGKNVTVTQNNATQQAALNHDTSANKSVNETVEEGIEELEKHPFTMAGFIVVDLVIFGVIIACCCSICVYAYCRSRQDMRDEEKEIHQALTEANVENHFAAAVAAGGTDEAGKKGSGNITHEVMAEAASVSEDGASNHPGDAAGGAGAYALQFTGSDRGRWGDVKVGEDFLVVDRIPIGTRKKKGE